MGTDPSELRARLADSLREAVRGRLARPSPDPTGVAAESDETTSLGQCLRSLRWLAGVDEGDPPRAAELAAPPSDAYAAEAAARTAKVALVALDPGELFALGDADIGTALVAWSAALQGTLAAGLGRSISDERLAEAEHDARRDHAAELVLELSAIRALVSEGRGELDEAVLLARRSWRMARTERMPQSEYLASLALARLRRLTGRPFLATRILTALRRFVSPPWHRWIDWELVAAGGEGDARDVGPAQLLATTLNHARQGRRREYDEAAACLSSTPLLAPLARDSQRILAALQPEVPVVEGDDALLRWRRAEHPFDPPPYGLAALSQHKTPCAVVTAPGERGRRLLRVGAGLFDDDVDRSLLDDSGRTEALASALALAGPEGLPDAELFVAAYGFAFDPALHRGALDVALHRLRRRLGDLATLERGGGRVTLIVHVAFITADPRSMPQADDRVLGLLAAGRDVGARELAGMLDMPLRTVQTSLREMVEAGACQQQRVGRRIVYSVEDTTFQEPTRA